MPTAFIPRSGEDDDQSPIYLARFNDTREASRAIGISLLGIDPSGPATFLADNGTDLSSCWKNWLADAFENRLGVPFTGIYMATGEMRNRRIAELDREIDSRLSPEERTRSLAAAAPFLEGTSEIRRLPQWTKFLEKVESGVTPGHVTSLFALRSAVFHLPLLPALISYLYFEWNSGAGRAAALEGQPLSPDRFQGEFPEGVEAAKRLFDTATGGPIQLESI